MIETLQLWEQQLLLLINTEMTHPWMDWFFYNVTDLHKNWIFNVLVVGLVLFFSYRKYGKECWRVVLALILTIAIGDMFSYRVLKATVDRPRPFQSEALKDKIIQRKEAHGNSFPSNHATNTFGSATVLAAAFPACWYIFYIFAAIVGYSRLYLGVHYPSDVLTGALIGFIVARIVSRFLLNKFKTFTRPRS